MKGNAVLSAWCILWGALYPTAPDPSPRHLTQGLPPTSRPGDWEMLASCPEGRQQPGAEWMEVTLSVHSFLLLQTYPQD